MRALARLLSLLMVIKTSINRCESIGSQLVTTQPHQKELFLLRNKRGAVKRISKRTNHVF